jgi:integrase
VEGLPAGDDPKAPLCPAFQGKTVSWLSNQFYEVMASAGLVRSRGDHQKKVGKAGRGTRRQLSDISFHALRHTATSLLKNAGVSDVVTRDIIGHESAAISRNYTHIEAQTKRAALDKLPDVTKAG